MESKDIDIWLGIDVGKTSHWATGLDKNGISVWNHEMPNKEHELRQLYTKLGEHGTIVVVVDQPATIGALAIAVAQDMGIECAYLPGLAMRRIADLYPGNSKTDQRDAFIIADAARTMPHTLRAISISEENEAELAMLTGFDEDLAKQITQTRNRVRGLLTQIHPSLEAVIGPRLDNRGILEILHAWPTPADLHHAGRARIAAKLKKYGAHRHHVWADEIWKALHEQSVTVIGTNAAKIVLPHLVTQLGALYQQRADIETRIEELVATHPLYPVLTSMPGIAVRTSAIIIAELAGKQFPNAAALASYAGLAPRTRQSGSSIRSDTVSHSGNKRLKRALFLSAFACLRTDPISRHYYDRKRAQGKRHNQAIIALAHKRCAVLFAMLRDGTFYEPQPIKQLQQAA